MICATLPEALLDRAMLDAAGLHPTEVDLAEANHLLEALSEVADPDWRAVCRTRRYKVPAWLTDAVGAIPMSEAEIVTRYVSGPWLTGRGPYRLLIASGRISQGGRGRGRVTLIHLRRPISPVKKLPGSGS